MRKIQRMIQVNKNLSLTLCTLLSLIILFSANLGAQENAGLNSVRLTPISQAQSALSPAIKADQSTDPRANKIAERLRECINAIRSAPRESSRALTLPESRRGTMAAESRKRIAADVDVRFRPVAGTPRQIKVKAKRKGAVLQQAMHGLAAGRERDEKTARGFLGSRRGLLRISRPDEELELSRYEEDHLGRRHLRYCQTYRGLPVWPAELNIHLDQKGNVDLMNGAFVSTPRRLVTQPVLEPSDATERARAEVPDGEESVAREPVLIIYAPGDRASRLAWKVELCVSVASNWLVVIDALNGETLTAYNQIANANVHGSGVDLFGVTQSLNVWKETGTFYMVDTSKPMYDARSDPPHPNSTRGAIIVRDVRNEPPEGFCLYDVTSGSATSGWFPDAVSAAYNLSETYDYYLERHNRSSIDGQGCSIIAAVRIDQNYKNAFWSSEHHMMFFGDGAPFAGALDIVAHELTHGVTSHTANLVYKDQSGALNESFSDIFGEMVEARTTGAPDWLMGAMLSKPARSLSDPSSLEIQPGLPYPSKMSEFVNTTEDNGGVHFNMTIVAHAFYLLAEGLNGAIGTRDAERIFYRALVFHLVANSQFIDARLACIVSAEELFGADSIQALKTAEAFDAVEIFDDADTPEPPPFPGVSGPDAAVFVYYDTDIGAYFLGRREEALGDGQLGVPLSTWDVARSRPSVSGDGSYAVFVDSINDICFIDTDGSTDEDCLGFDGLIHSVAMSPDGNLFSFVFLEHGERSNSIDVIDLQQDETRTFELVAPVLGGVSTHTILCADAMDFTADGKYIIYDAFNVIQLDDGSQLEVWSIYAIDLVTEQTLALVPSVPGLNIGYPALSQTSDNFITFDVHNKDTRQSTIYAGNLNTGDLSAVATVTGEYGFPGYTGDDTAIVYSQPDSYTSTDFSLWRRSIAEDRISPMGSPTLFLSDVAFGVIYRRGTFVPPEANISVSPESLPFEDVFVGNSSDAALTISNTGTANLKINTVSITGTDASEFSIVGGACTGQTLPPSGTCTVNVVFSPTSGGAKSATFSVQSDDPDTQVFDVQISGIGISANQSPVADAGPDQTVNEGETVTLEGSNSSDPDDGIASYLWEQTAGTPVTLSDASAVQPTFTSPGVGPDGESLTFQLTVTDNGGLQHTDTCVVKVTPADSETPSNGGGNGGGGCFIATAAFGSYMEPHVKVLRDFRDACLLTNRAGQVFVKLYYKYSTPVADFIADHEGLKAAVRCALYPAVGLSYIALHTTPAQQAFMMLGLVFVFSGAVMVKRRLRRRDF